MLSTIGRDALIILAAGEGKRIRPNTDNIPKALLDINGRTILDYQLDAAVMAGINQVIVVTGYLSPLIEKHIQSFNTGSLPIDIVVNHEYQQTNTLASLFLALNKLDLSKFATIYFIDGDIIFEPQILVSLKKEPYQDLVAVESDYYYYFLDNPNKVRIGEDGFVQEVSNTIPSLEASALSMELFKFSSATAWALRKKTEKLLLEDQKLGWDIALNEILRSGEYLAFPHDISAWNWWEIDTATDYNIADRIFTKEKHEKFVRVIRS
jgi:choline kinase